MVELKNCKIVVDKKVEYSANGYDKTEEWFLQVEMPLPGGKAVYELEITKNQYESFVTADKLGKATA